MLYFNTGKIFLVPSFDLEVKEQERIERFLTLLDNSGVGKIIEKYIKNNTSKGGRPGYNYYHLFATIIYGFAFTRCTLSLNKFWTAPDNLEPEIFKKPSWKRLTKKGRKLNIKMKENMGK